MAGAVHQYEILVGARLSQVSGANQDFRHLQGDLAQLQQPRGRIRRGRSVAWLVGGPGVGTLKSKYGTLSAWPKADQTRAWLSIKYDRTWRHVRPGTGLAQHLNYVFEA